MIKAILLPIRSKHAYDIMTLLKTLEVRTWIPKDYVGWIYGYVTKDSPHLTTDLYGNYKLYKDKRLPYMKILNGLIPFRFWFDEYETIKYSKDDNDPFYEKGYYVYESILDLSCLTHKELTDYGKGKDIYAWHIKKLEIFEKPMELGEFYRRIDGLDEDGGFKLNTLSKGEYVSIPQLKEKYLLTKAPQSYQYVWVNKNG